MLSSPESIDVHSVLSHLVIEDPFRGAEQARRFRAVSARCFQRVQDRGLFRTRQSTSPSERRVNVPEACAVWSVGGR